MKILYIANVRIPTEKAHGHQIMKMAETLAASSAAVELILPTRKNLALAGLDPFVFYQIKKKFKVRRIFSPDPVWLLKLPAGWYIKFQALIFLAGLTIYFLTTKRADKVVYTRDEYLLPLLQLFFKSVVWEGHALPTNLKHYLKYLKNCRRLIVLTAAMKGQLVAAGVPENKILVSPDAVDLAVFDIGLTKEQARQQLNLPADLILLGYTGSFKTKGMDKGLADIFRALVLLSRPVKFIAVGGNAADLDFYRRLATELGVADRVELRGQVSQGELAVYQKAFDILLMPFPYTKHYAYFMSPLKMFEYLAAHRPIIASDLPAVREILNEQNSLLVRPDDPRDLAEKINLLLDQPERAEQLAAQSYQLARRYTWEARAEKIINFLR